MSDDLVKRVNVMIMAGDEKKIIWERLKGEEDQQQLSFLLNNEASLKDKQRYLYVNLLLAILLAFITFKKVMFAMASGNLDLYWLASLVVPMINIYVLRKILRFHKTGYQYLFVLSALALFRPENRLTPEIYVYISLIILSGLLYLKIYPAKNVIK